MTTVIMFSHIKPKPPFYMTFFKKLLGTPLPVVDSLDWDSLVASTSLTPSQAEALVLPFSLDEIKAVFFFYERQLQSWTRWLWPCFLQAQWGPGKKPNLSLAC
jgi:hypothetical protein